MPLHPGFGVPWRSIQRQSRGQPRCTARKPGMEWEAPRGCRLLRSLCALGSTRVPNDTASGTWGPRRVVCVAGSQISLFLKGAPWKAAQGVIVSCKYQTFSARAINDLNSRLKKKEQEQNVNGFSVCSMASLSRLCNLWSACQDSQHCWVCA